jgi:RNA polymerase sigma-70 factor (ECF subfamily)
MSLKLSSPASPSVSVQALAANDRVFADRAFSDVYAAWFHRVERWCAALGCPLADLEDVSQEVFLVVRRRIVDFDGENLAGWLYRITARKVKDHRRKVWFRNLFTFREAVDDDNPEETCARRQKQRLLHEVLGRMSDKRREAFVLYELEGLDGAAIAALLEIPLQTVWTRLHHARREFEERVAELQRKGRLP